MSFLISKPLSATPRNNLTESVADITGSEGRFPVSLGVCRKTGKRVNARKRVYEAGKRLGRENGSDLRFHRILVCIYIPTTLLKRLFGY